MGIAITGVGAGYAQPELVGDQTTLRTGHPQHAEARPREAAPVDLDQTVKDIERLSLAFNKKLRFTVDSRLDEVIVKVIDPETDKVIKELPPEELQRLHLRLKEMIGLLFDEIV